jgi:hypothetical protein
MAQYLRVPLETPFQFSDARTIKRNGTLGFGSQIRNGKHAENSVTTVTSNGKIAPASPEAITGRGDPPGTAPVLIKALGTTLAGNRGGCLDFTLAFPVMARAW